MAGKVSLKIARCPTCSGQLKVEKLEEPIECVYCGNIVIPSAESTSASEATDIGSAGKIRIEGMKTPSSALAYIEQFFEDYDWEAFSYAQALSIAEIDKLVATLKMNSADDVNTWNAAFKAVFVPYNRKIYCCKNIVSDIIEKYKKDDLDSYSKFDAYKRVSSMICRSKDTIVANLEKIIEKASRYGASAEDISKLKDELESIKNSDDVAVYSKIEDIPEIKEFINGKNAKIAEKLAANGINADKEYARAKELIANKSYVEALDILVSLEGYSDSDALASEIDKYYLVDNVLEIEGVLYYFKKEVGETPSLSLYPTENGRISAKPIIRFIKKIVTNYADTIYYLDTDSRLRKYSLSAKTDKKLYKKAVSKDSMYVYNRRVYLLTTDVKGELLELNLSTGEVKVIIGSVKNIISLTDNKMVYFGSSKVGEEKVKMSTNVINLDTLEITKIGERKLTVEGFLGDHVVYTCFAPTAKNLNLYVKQLGNDDSEKLIEKNICEFRKILGDKLLYSVGNTSNKSLIYANVDGSERKEWALNISDLLFEQSGWVYFLRKSGYNTVLCKAHIGDDKFFVIASDVEKFVEIKNGYLYYINFSSYLVKVRMDGSNLKRLCNDVETVLTVKEDKVIFVSVDERVRSSEFSQASRAIKSIYSVDFTGVGKKKLVYNVEKAQEYDENTVYYVAKSERINTGEYSTTRKVDCMFKLDVEKGTSEKLLDLTVAVAEQAKKSSPVFKIALAAAAILVFIALISFIADGAGFGVFCIFMAIIAGVVAICFKGDSSQKTIADQLKEKFEDMKNDTINK